MNWSEFIRHNRWQKLTAFLLAVLIWFTVARKLRTGGGVRLTFDGSSRIFDGVPVRVLAGDGPTERCVISPPRVAVTLRGDPGLLNRLRPDQIHALAILENPATKEVVVLLEVFATGFEVAEVSPKEVLIRPAPATTNSP